MPCRCPKRLLSFQYTGESRLSEVNKPRSHDSSVLSTVPASYHKLVADFLPGESMTNSNNSTNILLTWIGFYACLLGWGRRRWLKKQGRKILLHCPFKAFSRRGRAYDWYSPYCCGLRRKRFWNLFCNAKVHQRCHWHFGIYCINKTAEFWLIVSIVAEFHSKLFTTHFSAWAHTAGSTKRSLSA